MSSYMQLLGERPVSIQKVSITTNAVITNTSYTINEVNPDTTVVFAGQVSPYFAGGASSPGHIELSSPTTLISRGPGTGGASLGHDVYVVDFGAMVKRVQRGFVIAVTNNIPLDPVDPAKCMVLLSAVTQGSGHALLRHTLTANTLVLSRVNMNVNVSWQVVEFW